MPFYDLKDLGYTSAVVHNNGGNFYSRANAFSMMGFDEFTSKELLDITEYTPLGSWATDDILVGGTKDALDATRREGYGEGEPVGILCEYDPQRG